MEGSFPSMGKRAASILLACLFGFGLIPVRAGTERPDEVPGHSDLAGNDPARASGPAEGAGRLEMRREPVVSSYREHMPLALFSLGSLAMGGVFWGIHSTWDNPGPSPVSGDGTRMNLALGAAGFTALAAGACYAYYASRGAAGRRGWAGSLSGGVAPDGSMAASLTVPLSSLSSFSHPAPPRD